MFKIHSKYNELGTVSIARCIWDKTTMIFTPFSTLYKNESLDKLMLNLILKRFADLSLERLYIKIPNDKKSFFLENHFSELKNGVTITKSTLKGINNYEENNRI